MIPTIAFIVFLISFVLTVIGGSTHQFILLTVSITLASLSLIIFSITFDKNSKHIKEKFRGKPMSIIRLVLLMLGIASTLISSLYVRDLPNYLNGEYKIVEGIPTHVEYSSSRYDGSGLNVTLKNKVFRINPEVSIEKIKGKNITIYYLPHSDWVIKYEIESQGLWNFRVWLIKSLV